MPEQVRESVRKAETAPAPKASHEMVGTLDLTAYVEKYQLSPFDTQKIERFVKEIAGRRLHSSNLDLYVKEVPKACLQTPEMQEFIKHCAIKTVRGGRESIGLPHEFVEEFGIEPEFFAEPYFDEYRKREWTENLSKGRNINFETGENEDVYWWGSESEERQKEEQIDMQLFGRLTTVRHLFTDAEYRAAGMRGILTLIRESDKEKNAKNELLVQQYKKNIGISDAEVHKAALDYMKHNVLDVIPALEERYPEIKAFYQSDEGRSLARHNIEQRVADSDDVRGAIERFGFKPEDFNKKELFDASVKSLTTPTTRFGTSTFYSRLDRQSDIFGDKIYDEASKRIMAANPDTIREFLDESFMMVSTKYHFLGKETERFKKLGFSQEVLDNYLYERIQRLGRSPDFYASKIDADSDKYEIFGMRPETKNEALSGVYFKHIVDRGIRNYDEHDHWWKKSLNLEDVGFTVTPRVMGTIKNEYMSRVESGDMYALKTLELFLEKENVSLSWTREEHQRILEAAKKGLIQVSSKGLESITDFLHRYFPERHTVFHTEDPKTKQAVVDHLSRELETIEWSQRYLEKSYLNEALDYFSIPREAVSAALEERVKDTYLNQMYASRIEGLFSDFNVAEHNERWAKTYGIEKLSHYMAAKNFAMVETVTGQAGAQELFADILRKQEAALEDPNSSVSMRTYAIDFIKYFFWESSFVKSVSREDRRLLGEAKLHEQSGFIERLALKDPSLRSEYFKEYIEFFRSKISEAAHNVPLEGVTKDEYELVCREVYPERNYNTYKHMDVYEDRTKDLEKYVFDREGYDMRLSGLLGYRLKEGTQEDEYLLQEFSERIETIRNIANADSLKRFLDDSIAESKATTMEGKILEYFKQKGYSVDTMNVLLAYQLLGSYDTFVAASADRVSQEESRISKNYIMLDELVNRYGDTMKETIKTVQKAVAESDDKKLFAGSFGEKHHTSYSELADSILQDLARVPREKLKDETIQKKISRTLKNAFQKVPMVQERADYFGTLFGRGDMDTFAESWEQHFNELFSIEDTYMIDTGKVEALQSSVYQRLQNEIGKYEEIKEVDESRKGEEKLSKERLIKGYFSKNKENAHARMVGDVCLAQDPNMLKNENYFEFVLFDQERKKCMGTTMLLEMQEAEKKYLLYCPNPSVGLVSEVSAKRLYKIITDRIQEFAKQNNFDAILVNKEHGRSTNRAGLFQQSLDQSCMKDSAGRPMTINLENVHTLGGGYTYQKDLNYVWKKG